MVQSARSALADRSQHGALSGIIAVLLVLSACTLPRSRVATLAAPQPPVNQTGIASWYGPGFHGKATASGEIYNQHDLTAAHQTLPLGARVMVTNLENSRSTEVLVNDRGPFAKERIIDLSLAAAQAIDMVGPGTALVRIDILDSPVPLAAVRSSLDYTLQLGSFTQLENAQQLRNQLVKFHPEVDIRPLKAADKTFYRVHLGTFSNRAAAEVQARQIAQSGFSVIIMEK